MTGQLNLFVVVFILVLVLLAYLYYPVLFASDYADEHVDQTNNANQEMVNQEMNQKMINQEMMNQKMMNQEENEITETSRMEPRYGIMPNKGIEPLVFDSDTNTIMTGSEFMYRTGIATPGLIAPAWDPNQNNASDFFKYEREAGKTDAAVLESDPRFIYNKCSSSCCSPQYPVPFDSPKDPFVCDINGNGSGDGSYLSSNYSCTNNVGGTGCMCLTEDQVDMLQSSV